MRPLRQIIAYVAVSVLLLYGSGCSKKPSQLPTQAKAPVDTIPSTLPPEISEETPPPPPPPQPKQEEPPPEPAKPKPAQHHKKKNPTPPPATTAQGNAAPPGTSAPANSGNTTMAVAHPPANPAGEAPPNTAIGADVNSAALSQQKQTTTQLLEETEKTLNGLTRTLSHDEEEIVNQIRSYIGQSRNATKEGDFERAYNLATKAHLLSDALAKK